MSTLIDDHGSGRLEERVHNKDLMTRSLSKALMFKTMPMLDKVHRSQRYRYGSRLEQTLYEVLRLSIEAPRAKTITKCAALVDSIDLLHDVLEIGASHQKLIKGEFLASIMRPRDRDHPGGELWQLSAIAKTMLMNSKSKKKG